MSQNFSFVKTPEEMQALRAGRALYVRKKVLSFSWYIDDAVYRKVLPPGLEPTEPRASGFVAMFPFAGAGLAPYAEGAIFLSCAKDGVPGAFCLAMPVDGPNEMGIYLGREMYGYPKKLSKVTLRRQGDAVYGSIERNGIKYIEVNALIGPPNHADGAKLMPAPPLEQTLTTHAYLFNYRMQPGGMEGSPMNNFAFSDVRLIRQRNLAVFHEYDPCSIEVKLTASESDPWVELAPKEIIGGSYSIQTGEMLGTQVVKEYGGQEVKDVEPYLLMAYDINIVGKQLEFFY